MSERVILGAAHTTGPGALETAYVNPQHVILVRLSLTRTGNDLWALAHLHDVAGKVTTVNLGKNLKDDEIAEAAQKLVR